MIKGGIYSVSAFLVVTVFTVAINGAPQQSNQLAAQWAGNAASTGQVGRPQFHLSGGGSGSSFQNWGAGGNVGVGVKPWQSQNGQHAVGVGANVAQSFGQFQGQSWQSKPNFGVGAAYTYTFGGRRPGRR